MRACIATNCTLYIRLQKQRSINHLAPCQVSKYLHPHLTHRKNDSSSCCRKSWGQCQDRETGIHTLQCASCRPASLRQQSGSSVESDLSQLLWTGGGSSQPVLMSHGLSGAARPCSLPGVHCTSYFWLLVTCSLLRETGVSRTPMR